MKNHTGRVLILGSGPNAVEARSWGGFDAIVAINNAHAVRPDWTHLIHPEDFPANRMPVSVGPDQTVVTAADYVPVQNTLGGFVYAGGTMAFTAGYWALAALKPRVMAFIGCDMVYPTSGNTHFYGSGTADPLRADVTLQDLGAKSARLHLEAAARGCACVNLSTAASRLVFPRMRPGALSGLTPVMCEAAATNRAREAEAALGYMVPSGRYWKEQHRLDARALSRIDALWLAAFRASQPEVVRKTG